MNYKLKDLLDVPKLQELLDSLDEVHTLPSAIIDMEGNILTATAWQDICTKFHRINPDTEKKCIESDLHIGTQLTENMSHVIYRCPMGLVDTATPIVIEGKHLGNVFTGQLFMEPPDESHFKEQARQYCFDEDEYLAAMRRVPLFSKEQLHKNLAFIARLAQMLAEQGIQAIRQRDALQELKKNEEFIRSIIASSIDCIKVLDLEGHLLSLSEGGQKLLEIDDIQPFLGLSWIDFWKDDKEGAQYVIAKAASGEVGIFNGYCPTAKGTPKWWEVIVSPIRGADGSIENLLAVSRDITKRKQDFEQMENLSQRLQLATSSAHLGVWDWNVRENIMEWDDRMFDIYGISKNSSPNNIDSWQNGLHPEDKESAIAACRAALNGEQEFDTVFRVIHPDGTVKHVKANGLVIRGDDGSAERMIGINVDITDSKNSEEEKNKLETRLQQAQKMESIGNLAGGVAHDFNNKLTVIIGYACLAKDEFDVAKLHDYISAICKAAEQSADLTRQLLAFARKQTIAPKVLDLNETVSGMLKMLQRLIGEDINLNWLPAQNLWEVELDPSQIDQILANLCVNARDSIDDVGKITIETGVSLIDDEYCSQNAGFVTGEYVRLTVSDDGCGMDKETLAQIFEPFFTTKALGEGTGLGLATVYGIVKQNSGFINVYSEPGLGTTFTIYLPRYVGKSEKPKATVTVEPSKRGLETVLLVEDEPAILNITTIILKKQGYTVLAANSPGKAIQLASAHPNEIHLLMTDVVMPEMNGRDLAKKLQSLYPRLKCLYMSGYTANVIAHHGVLDTGLHFIQKPFNLNALAGKLREVLNS